MTVQKERTDTVPAPPEEVWNFISDAKNRAKPITVVSGFHFEDEEENIAIWEVNLPIPLIDKKIEVKTEEIDRRPPEYVRFVGRSKVMRVVGEHELVAIDDGTELHSKFKVDGRIPGIEQYFKRRLGNELDNVRDGLIQNIDDNS